MPLNLLHSSHTNKAVLNHCLNSKRNPQMQPTKHPYHLALKWVEQNEEIQGLQSNGTWRDIPHWVVTAASENVGNMKYHKPNELRIKPKVQTKKEPVQLELDFTTPEQPPSTLLDYQKYNISVGQVYAQADDAELQPTLVVLDVLTYAERGDVVVAWTNSGQSFPAFCIDCFKLSKVRYVLVQDSLVESK